jgi:predicted dithiol-disulfide oxidoreductase (DUF899 family)
MATFSGGETGMSKIASNDEWLAARLELLEDEKAFQKARDDLAHRRRDLPYRQDWVRRHDEYL